MLNGERMLRIKSNHHPFHSPKEAKTRNKSIKCVVYLADTTGELIKLIRCADIAFLGKTLPPRHEGQNPVEPVSTGLPLVLGPSCTNFKKLARNLLDVVQLFRGKQNQKSKKSFMTCPRMKGYEKK